MYFKSPMFFLPLWHEQIYFDQRSRWSRAFICRRAQGAFWAVSGGKEDRLAINGYPLHTTTTTTSCTGRQWLTRPRSAAYAHPSVRTSRLICRTNPPSQRLRCPTTRITTFDELFTRCYGDQPADCSWLTNEIRAYYKPAPQLCDVTDGIVFPLSRVSRWSPFLWSTNEHWVQICMLTQKTVERQCADATNPIHPAVRSRPDLARKTTDLSLERTRPRRFISLALTLRHPSVHF